MSSWFEQNSNKIAIGFYTVLGIGVLVGIFFGVKSVRDEINRGYERFIVLRERRPMFRGDRSPGDNVTVFSDSLEVRKYPLRVDDDGFIMPSKVHQEADLDIVFFGGSTTECMFVDEDRRFPSLFGRELEKRTGKTVNSYNGGNAGNNAFHSVLALQAKGLPIKPDAVVLMHNINDLTFLLLTNGYWAPHFYRGIVQVKEYNAYKTYLIEHFMKAKTLKGGEDEFADYRGRRVDIDVPFMTGEFGKMLELFVFICRQNGITPVLMTQFNRLTDNPDKNVRAQMEWFEKSFSLPYTEYIRAYRALNETIRNVAASNNVPLVDLDRLVPKESRLMYDLVHLNGEGSVFVAGLLADWFQRDLADVVAR